MIEIANEVFEDEIQANAWISTLLELKFGYEHKLLKKLTFQRKRELYKSAKRRLRKGRK